MDIAGLKVMVIDDSNTIRRSAEIFLGQAGCEVLLAEDGFDALAKITDHKPDVIFVDIMMPRLDGYQTCALIKKNARLTSTPVIMLSSRDGLFDRARGRMVGSDEYLTKPFTKDSLLKAVATHAAVTRRAESLFRRTSTMPISTILVVDDSPTERLALQELLSREGYKVLTAESGEQAVERSKADKPDLILMDVVMPGMNGYQATRTISRHESTRNIPIIMCTSKGQETDKIWGMRQGALAYLVKPVDHDELLARIRAMG